MQMTLRWFGPSDPIPLQYIRQIPGVRGVVSALYDVPVGEMWPRSGIERLAESIDAAGLALSVIESIPVHEDIKLGRPTRDRLIEHYGESVRHMGELGIRVLCYNFMPVFDWTRTDLALALDDGSTALAYDHRALERIDLSRGTGDLPGWATAYSAAELRALLDAYRHVTSEQLWEHLAYFLERVVPVAAESNVKMAIHPDDPPFNILGLPRIVSTAEDLEYILSAVPNASNGICFCTGSLGAHPANNLPEMARMVGDRIHFVHLRNVRKDAHGNFFEDDHLGGDVDMYAVMKEILAIQQQAEAPIPFRPDHGHQMMDDLHKTTNPGYSAIGRMRGLAELRGLQLGICRSEGWE